MEILESTENIDSLINLLKSDDLGLVNMTFILLRKKLTYTPVWLKSCAVHVHNNEIYMFRTADGYYLFNTHLESMVINDYHIFAKTIDGVMCTFILDTKSRNVYDLCFKHIIKIPHKFNIKSNIIFKKGDDWLFAETLTNGGEIVFYDRFANELSRKTIPKSYFIVGYEKGSVKMGGLKNGGFKRIKVPKIV